jgi:predicted pyridoxine 5'-phosphate oxidase superfamily flavin-nucleotide-binding protein
MVNDFAFCAVAFCALAVAVAPSNNAPANDLISMRRLVMSSQGACAVSNIYQKASLVEKTSQLHNDANFENQDTSLGW